MLTLSIGSVKSAVTIEGLVIVFKLSVTPRCSRCGRLMTMGPVGRADSAVGASMCSTTSDVLAECFSRIAPPNAAHLMMV